MGRVETFVLGRVELLHHSTTGKIHSRKRKEKYSTYCSIGWMGRQTSFLFSFLHTFPTTMYYYWLFHTCNSPNVKTVEREEENASYVFLSRIGVKLVG